MKILIGLIVANALLMVALATGVVSGWVPLAVAGAILGATLVMVGGIGVGAWCAHRANRAN